MSSNVPPRSAARNVAVEVHSIANMFETAEALHAAGYSLRELSREPDGRCLVLARG